jgi:anaerobic magnesium-protoporphyrin IX monomethyl ester cyclase
MLLGAALQAGHRMTIADLNATWIRERSARMFLGDHDRPTSLRELHDTFKEDLGLEAPRESHEEVYARARKIVSSRFGGWCSQQLSTVEHAPHVIGLSVMYRDQVEPALAITMQARTRWPGALIVWGGAHVTALQDEIAKDARYGAELIDGFVFGYAEQTWIDVLDCVADETGLPLQVIKAGSGVVVRARENIAIAPVFVDLARYARDRLTIPMQTSRGCTYGICGFCTYPTIEGTPREVPIGPIDEIIMTTIASRAALSFKDSLLDGDRLEFLAERIAGQVQWSACTKLDARLPDRLRRLRAGGCATLEIGLETIEPDAQRVIDKRQRWDVLLRFLDAAERADIAVVINYMTGLPGANPAAEAECMARVLAELDRRPLLVSRLEHNSFQLERLSPMGRSPRSYGIRVTRSLPWSTVLDWESLPTRDPDILVKLRRPEHPRRAT